MEPITKCSGAWSSFLLLVLLDRLSTVAMSKSALIAGKDKKRRNLIHLAVLSNDFATVEFLKNIAVAEGVVEAIVCEEDRYLFTSLNLACYRGCSVEIVRLLLESGAAKVINSPIRRGLLPLNYAAAKGKNEVVKLLLEQGAIIDSKANGLSIIPQPNHIIWKRLS